MTIATINLNYQDAASALEAIEAIGIADDSAFAPIAFQLNAYMAETQSNADRARRAAVDNAARNAHSQILRRVVRYSDDGEGNIIGKVGNKIVIRTVLREASWLPSEGEQSGRTIPAFWQLKIRGIWLNVQVSDNRYTVEEVKDFLTNHIAETTNHASPRTLQSIVDAPFTF